MAPENRRMVAAIRRVVSFAKAVRLVKASASLWLTKLGEILAPTLCHGSFLR